MEIKNMYYKYAGTFFHSLTERYHIFFLSFFIYRYYGIVNFLSQSWSVT